jgi:hypothetical protein
MSRCTFTCLAVVLAATAGCRAPLANTHASREALATAVLDGLVQRDRARLEALALNEQEFRDHVWPSLPAARPERNLPLEYVWSDLHQKSDAGLMRTLAEYGGRRFTLVGVEFGDRTDYGAYRVHREAMLRVRSASGDVETIRVCGSMIEQDGAWKVFSYVVDD